MFFGCGGPHRLPAIEVPTGSPTGRPTNLVRRGERSSLVVYANLYTKTEDDDDREPREKQIPFLKAYSVFNADQIENIPERFTERKIVADSTGEYKPHEKAVQFFSNTFAKIREDQDQAYYSVLEDAVYLPPFRKFTNTDRYYSTLAHEITHWTGHPSRQPRIFPKASFSPATYAREELVAELGAAFLCADLEINLTPRADHASYIGSWLQVLRNDKRAIFQAAAYAQKAVDFLQGLQPAAMKKAA
jgi:antirestriction protein ArdC